jgi:hypothetical protein
MDKTEAEVVVNEWLASGLYLRIARKTKYWALGLMKGIPADDLGQIVAMGLIVRSRRPGSTYKPSKGSVSNYIWMVTASSIIAAVNKCCVKQACEELDLTKYDADRPEEYLAFKDRTMDKDSIEQGDEEMLKDELLFNLKLDLDDGLITEGAANVVTKLLVGEPLKGSNNPDRDEGTLWLKNNLTK